MSMSWIYLILAGIAEIFFAAFLKLSDQFTKLIPTCLFIFFAGLSFYLMTKALVNIHISIVYAVWSGIGIIGTVILGFLYFDEPMGMFKILFLSLLIISIIGLKVVS